MKYEIRKVIYSRELWFLIVFALIAIGFVFFSFAASYGYDKYVANVSAETLKGIRTDESLNFAPILSLIYPLFLAYFSFETFRKERDMDYVKNLCGDKTDVPGVYKGKTAFYIIVSLGLFIMLSMLSFIYYEPKVFVYHKTVYSNSVISGSGNYPPEILEDIYYEVSYSEEMISVFLESLIIAFFYTAYYGVIAFCAKKRYLSVALSLPPLAVLITRLSIQVGEASGGASFSNRKYYPFFGTLSMYGFRDWSYFLRNGILLFFSLLLLLLMMMKLRTMKKDYE